MRPPPSCLPGPDSSKWHNRRRWDYLGYLRVRSLGNPNWQRDVDRLVRVLRAQESSPLIDDAIRATRRYREASVEEQDRAWDEVLESIDRFLEDRQTRHLAAVVDAGRSAKTSTVEPDSG